jgi:hypothetical protein
MKNEPNIFDFATGELSQDAFICWLLNWLDYNENHELKDAARKFILLLCKINHPSAENITLKSIGKLLPIGKRNILQQHGNMDIFFAVEINNESTEFIIEDKTNTFPHSNQLKKYVDFVLSDQVKKNYKSTVVKIYYKTGYIFEEDKNKCAFINEQTIEEREKYNFGILDCNNIYKFLIDIETDNLIFKSYRDYISKIKHGYEEVINELSSRDGYNNLRFSYFQYELMKEISGLCPETVGNKSSISYGSSYGIPWTQYRFVFLKNCYGEKINESVFYRFERRKSKSEDGYEYCLSIRQYAAINKIDKDKKLERLKIYKKLFTDAIKEVSGLSFGKAVKDKSGSNSSEIAVLFFDENKNNIYSLKNILPIVHSQFLTLINEDQYLNPELGEPVTFFA